MATSPARATSPASEESTSDRVQLTVDGVVVNTHAPPEGTPITDDDLLLRLRQQAQGVKHLNFLFLGTEDAVKSYVRQQRVTREQLSQQVQEVTAQRDAADAIRVPDNEQLQEAIRQCDAAHGQEFTARASVVAKSEEITDLTQEVSELRAEVTMMVAEHEVGEQERNLKYRRVTTNLERVSTLAHEVENSVTGMADPTVKATLGSKVDDQSVCS